MWCLIHFIVLPPVLLVKKGRQWVGIDVSIEAYKQVKKRLAKEITPEGTRPSKESSFTKRGSNVCIVSIFYGL